MKNSKIKRLWPVVLVAIILCIVIVLLKIEHLIESNDFSVLIAAVMIGSIVIVYFENITEISIIGTSVKLQQVNKDSEELLKKLQIENFKVRLGQISSGDGLFGDGRDTQYEFRSELYELVTEIKKADLQDNEDLKNKFLPILTLHIDLQLKTIQQFGCFIDPNPLVGIEDPEDLENAITDKLVEIANVKMCNGNIAKLKSILDNIELYKKLIQAKNWFLK
ncbi:Uncharacterised protein [Acinetobacter baumannii]|nr:hypothetical protein [Acinetobacter baumannii]MDC4725110.1 hypothetical protein [Acinetobacter baumannii]MDC4977141.1 hypothetical protein [Acinetobacter baumannii]MDC5083803.1 hypothetical protein [Acinetobacter baumannii]MDC5122325.1 hypothetical protein [Acinetobacter baumannii]MDC5291012.1 hypothetical protein [Acinetobacter baumannii]